MNALLRNSAAIRPPIRSTSKAGGCTVGGHCCWSSWTAISAPQYDFTRPWNCPDNLAVADMMKQDGPYQCPGERAHNSLNTSYVMLVGPQAFSGGATGRRPEEITDGPANTIAVVEMSPSGIGWTAPYDLNVSEMSFKINDPDRLGVRSCHAGRRVCSVCQMARPIFLIGNDCRRKAPQSIDDDQR